MKSVSRARLLATPWIAAYQAPSSTGFSRQEYWSGLPLPSLSSAACVQLFVTPWTAACQAFLSITNAQNLLKLMSIESVMPSNNLILCCALLLLPSIFPSIRVFPNKSLFASGGVAGALQTFVHLSLSAALESRCCLLLSPVDK